MKLKGTLEALYSERDRAGNCYWALRYTDHAGCTPAELYQFIKRGLQS